MGNFSFNVRVLGNGAIFVQYSEEGQAKDAGFQGWVEFIAWLTTKVGGKNDVSI